MDTSLKNKIINVVLIILIISFFITIKRLGQVNIDIINYKKDIANKELQLKLIKYKIDSINNAIDDIDYKIMQINE